MAMYGVMPSPAATPSPREPDIDRRFSAPTILITSHQSRHDSKVELKDLPPSPCPSPKPVQKVSRTDSQLANALESPGSGKNPKHNAPVGLRAIGDNSYHPPPTQPVGALQHRVPQDEATHTAPSRFPRQVVHPSPAEREALLAGPTISITVANRVLFPTVPKSLLVHFSRKAASTFNTTDTSSMRFDSVDPSVLKYIIHHLLSTSSTDYPPPVYSGHMDKMLSIYYVAHSVLDIPTISYALRKSLMQSLHERPLTAAELRFITEKFSRDDQLSKIAINKTIDFRIADNLPDAEEIDRYLAEQPGLERHFVELTQKKFDMIARSKDRWQAQRAERHAAWLQHEAARKQKAGRRAEREARKAQRWDGLGTKETLWEDKLQESAVVEDSSW